MNNEILFKFEFRKQLIIGLQRNEGVQKFVIINYLEIENGNFTSVGMIAKMHSRNKEKSVGFVELGKLSILPTVNLHIIVVFYPGWIASIPQLIKTHLYYFYKKS